MSSLRDQLLAKGLVSKKKARAVGRELKADRRRRQGDRKKKKQAEAEARAAAEAERKAREAAALAERKRRELERERMERALRVRQILLANQIELGGPLHFHHRTLEGPLLNRLSVHEKVVFQLRNGDMGIAAVAHSGGHRYAVYPRRAIEALRELAPRLVVFHVTDTAGLSDPALGLQPTTADGDLRAHRKR